MNITCKRTFHWDCEKQHKNSTKRRFEKESFRVSELFFKIYPFHNHTIKSESQKFIFSQLLFIFKPFFNDFGDVEKEVVDKRKRNKNIK